MSFRLRELCDCGSVADNDELPRGLARRGGSSQRSLDQLRYWWAEPVKRLADHCGYTDSQMHYALLGECFGYTEVMGHAVPVKPSSSDLTVEEFSQLIEWVLTWAPAELGVAVVNWEVLVKSA